MGTTKTKKNTSQQWRDSSGKVATIPVARLPRHLERVFCLYANESRCYTQHQLSEILKISKYRVYRYTKQLLKLGLLQEEKIGKLKNYHKTLAGVTYSSNFFTGRCQTPVRSHNLLFSSHILRKPRNWLFDNAWRVVTVRNWKKYIGDGFEGCRVEITPKRVLFYVHELFGDSPDQNMSVASKLVNKAILQLHFDFPELVLGRPKNHYSVNKQHHALVEHSLSKKFPEDFNIELNRMSYDHSKGVGELEAFDSKYGQDDAVKVMDFTDKLVAGEYDFEALSALPQTIDGLQKFVASGTTLMNMLYAHQKRVEGFQTKFRKVRHYILEKEQKKISDW